jgi:hypothetical protein
LKQSDDESIFAWSWLEMPLDQPNGGLLAPFPAAFANSGNVVSQIFDEQRPSYSMMNKGLRIELQLISSGAKQYTAPINCIDSSKSRGDYAAQLALVLFSTARDQYSRISGYRILSTSTRRSNFQSNDIKRHVVHVPQPEKYKKYVGARKPFHFEGDIYSAVSEDFSSAQKLTFSFRDESAVEQGFWARQVYLKYFESHWIEIFNSSKKTKLNLFWDSGSGGRIVYENQDAEMFAVVLDIIKGRPAVRLMVFNHFPVLLDRWRNIQAERDAADKPNIEMVYYSSPWIYSDYDALIKRPPIMRHKDRVSKNLGSKDYKSIRSVSVALRPSTIKDPDAYSGFVVEITIDSSGSLRWEKE